MNTLRLSTMALVLGASLPIASQAETVISIDGSSTVFPITEVMAEEFQNANDDVAITIGVSGTGGGFKKFCRGETDVSNASRPIKKKELAACAENGIRVIELPVALDALAVVVNPENTWADEMTVEALKTMWRPEAQGKINNWNQVDDSYPDTELVLFGPGVDSGTYDYFTAAVVGKEHSSRGDYTASENDNVLVTGVSGDKNSLGFFGLAYYVENKDKLKAVAIKPSKDAPGVLPSFETAADGSYTPLSRPVFIYINSQSLETKPEVADFAKFYIDPANAKPFVSEVGYVPLPDSAYGNVMKRLEMKNYGSAFTDGSKIGASMDEITGSVSE